MINNMIKSEEIKYVEKLINSFENKAIKDRVENVLLWNVKKARRYRRSYYFVNVITIIGNATIPVVNQMTGWKGMTLTTTIISSVAGVLTSILTLMSIKDKWYRYRKYAEELKTECFLFATKAGIYNSKKREELFVERLESICTDETKLWEKEFLKSDSEENGQPVTDEGKKDKEDTNSNAEMLVTEMATKS